MWIKSEIIVVDYNLSVRVKMQFKPVQFELDWRFMNKGYVGNGYKFAAFCPL